MATGYKTLYRNAFPDLQLIVEHMIEAGQLITTRFTSHGTHKGWVMWDALGLMQQLGAVPAVEKAKAQSL